MINFALPGLYVQYPLTRRLFEIWDDHPNWFNDNVAIDVIYGLFQFCIWDGGRIFEHYEHATAEQIQEIINFYQSRNIGIRLVLTNSQLTEEDYYDHYGNTILTLCQQGDCQIVCADDNFREYIHQNYPEYTFVSSTTKCLTKPDDLITELEKPEYKEVCLDYNLNRNVKLLEELSAEQKAKCEFLVNAICPPGCPSRKEHYKLNSLYHMSFGKRYCVPLCGITETNLNPSLEQNSDYLNFEDIKTYYKMGFEHFKLEGRTFPAEIMAGNYVKYLVKPQFQIVAYSELLNF